MSRFPSLLLSALSLASWLLPAAAQTSRGTITGIVTDQTGASVPGAAVVLTGEISRSTTSNEAGVYRFDAVDLGLYRMEVKGSGFRTFSMTGVPSQAGQITSIDVKLEIGEAQTVVSVSESASAVLQYEAPVRGGNFSSVQNTQLPLPLRNPVALAVTLPGVSSNRYGFGTGTGTAGSTSNSFIVNGTRGRSSNFMIDGTENNDISVNGQGITIRNPEAVQEVSVQTSNFDAEFGRAGGAVVNVVTKSGGNSLRGSLNYLLDSTYDDALTNTQALNPLAIQRGRPLAGTEQFFGGTLGGPVRKNRTFYFASYQEQRQNSQNQNNLITPTAAGRQTLRSLFPQGTNPRADLYLDVTKDSVAASQPTSIALGGGRPNVEFGTATTAYANTLRDRQILGRADHKFSDRDFIMGRYMIQDRALPVGGATNFFPGYATSGPERFQTTALTHTHVFSPTLSNELRASYNRLVLDFPVDTQNPLGPTLPRYTIAGISAIGVQTNLPQGRIANNYQLQDAVSWVLGRHTVRAGFDLLEQRSRQTAPWRGRGELNYQAGGGFTAFANFLDDFGGSGGAAQRDFGNATYYPELFRQSYFVSDRWRVTNSLTLTIGLRYEDFGLPMNSLLKPAFSGLFNVDPVTFQGPYAEPNRVRRDGNNFGPSVGLAWSPGGNQGLLGRLMGDKKSVIRAGYQIGYDSFFNNIASNAVASTPNLIATAIPSAVSTALPRGTPGHSSTLPAAARAPRPTDAQTLMLENLRNPYYQRYSLGLQRELAFNLLADVSYVGTKGTRLFINEDMNPQVPLSLRIQPANVNPPFALQGRLDNLQGARTVRTNGGSSYYHALQTQLTRRFRSGLYSSVAYTFSKFIDNGSEIFGVAATGLPQQAAVPAIFGGQRLERGLSFFDRTHRFVLTQVYQLPFFKDQKGLAGRTLGGWQISGIVTVETGVPFTINNGLDADGLGANFDRPDYNPSGKPGVRAVPSPTSPTGYINPDAGNAPILASEAMYIGLPAHTGNTPLRTGNLGRNTWRGPGIGNWDATLQKNLRINERFSFELRGEFFNVLNRPQYGVPSVSPFAPQTNAALAIQTDLATSPAGRFLRPEFADGGARVLRYSAVLRF